MAAKNAATEKQTPEEIISNNTEVILETLGLDISKEELSGSEFITKDSKLLTRAEVMDTYYPTLVSKIVSQEVIKFFRGAKGLNKVFTKEYWVNGLKDIVYLGQLEVNDYGREITIADFNADDPTISEYVIKVDKRKLTKLVRPTSEIITAFTNPAKLTDFVMLLLNQLTDTFEKLFQDEKALILAEGADAPIALVPDVVVDTTDLETEDILKSMSEKIESFETASNEHTAIGLADESLVYSGRKENLVIVYNNKFKQDIKYDVQAKLFHSESALLDLESETIDFSKIKGMDATAADSIKGFIIDKNALLHGFQLDEVGNVINLPKLQTLIENHNWYGYARLENYPVIVFKDVSEPVKSLDSRANFTKYKKVGKDYYKSFTKSAIVAMGLGK